MRKLFFFILTLIILVLVVGFFAWKMAPKFISHKLSEETKVSVSIEDIYFGLSSIKIKNIRVGNPPHSLLKEALKVKTLKIDAPISRFFDEKIIIDKMELNEVYLGLEFESRTSTKGNWSTIMKNLKSSTDQGKKQASSQGKTKSVLIKKLIITDLNIDLIYQTGDQKKRTLKPIRRIEFENISSEGGLPTAQIMDIVLSEMLRNVFSKEGLKNMLENLITPDKSSKKPADILKGLFSDLILLENDWE